MNAAFVAVPLWVLVASLALTSRQRRSQRLLVAAALIAIAQTLNIDGVYLRVEELTGARNWTRLVANLVQVAGVSMLATGIARSVREQSSRQRRTLVAAQAFAVGIMACSFMGIDAPRSSRRFMDDYGSQHAAALFDGAGMVFMGMVLGQTCRALMMFLPVVSDRALSTGVWLLLTGCITAVAFSLTASVEDLARVTGSGEVVERAQSIRCLLGAAYVPQLCIGFVILPFARRSAALRREVDVIRMAAGVARLWRLTTPVDVQKRARLTHCDPEMRLHRQLIEIEDALLADSCGYLPTLLERRVIRKAQTKLARYAQLHHRPSLSDVWTRVGAAASAPLR